MVILLKGLTKKLNINLKKAKLPLEYIEDNIKHPKYIIFDFETDTSKNILEDGSVLLHQVMHVEADITKVSDNHIYIYMKIL